MKKFQINLREIVCCAFNFLFMKPARSIFVPLRFLLMIFFSFGHGIDFCFHGPEEGRF